MEEKVSKISFHGELNERTGYGVHASRFVEALSHYIPVTINGPGEVHISLVDSVSIQNINERLPYPSILYNAWESTRQPEWFMDRLKYFDQLWVPSEWQRQCSIEQGIPADFVKVVPEGVDPNIFKPDGPGMAGESYVVGGPQKTFDFLLVGKWEPRKNNLEICRSFLAAFPAPQFPNIRLFLSCDTLFNCDEYHSTEERLIGYGLQDPRIIPVGFEDRDAYVRRLQSAHVFLSCSRAEGWGLPIIEAMACGIPTIVADWSGSTEYAGDAIKVRVLKLKKPEGIYGGWDVPGEWGEPDYDHLIEQMKDAYTNYSAHKEKALETSEKIRKDFSWDAAAQKAVKILSEMPAEKQKAVTIPPENKEDAIKAYARSLGYEIEAMRPRKVIFLIDSHPSDADRLKTLVETIAQVREVGFPIMLVTHYPIPPEVMESVDYFVYDKRDILSPPDDMPTYWWTHDDGTTEVKHSRIPCHALAALQNVRNGIDLCLGKFDWIYHMSSDTEVNIHEWVKKVNASDKVLIGSKWQGKDKTFSGQLVAARTDIMDKITPHIDTWGQFREMYGDARFESERVQHDIIVREVGLDNVEMLDIELGNRYDQVDRGVWEPDSFQCHFVEGPFFNVVGGGDNVYQVTYSNPQDGEYFAMDQRTNTWSRPDKKYFREWTIEAKKDGETVFKHTLDLKGKSVIISFGSKALGDTLAWIPYVEEFRKKHECTVYCSTWFNNILDYPEINFIVPGDAVENIYGTYDLGCFDGQLTKNVNDWRLTPLQKVAADILGLDYEPIRAKLKFTPIVRKGNGKPPKPYVCFSEFSTMQGKFWNRPGAWQNVIDSLNAMGYDCMSVSAEPTNMKNVIVHNGQGIEQTVADVAGAEFYIGLNAGVTWVAYSLGIPAVMITGVSEDWNDFPNPYRVAIDTCRPGCFNDPSLPIDRGMDWCPRKRDYICTHDITEEIVMDTIYKLREDFGHAPQKRKIGQGGRGKHKRTGPLRKAAKTGNSNRHVASRNVTA